MRRIKLILIGVVLMLPSFASAIDYPWLTFRMADDSEMSVEAENLSINYKDGNLILSSSAVDKTIPASQIKSMRFTATSAAVDGMFDMQSSAGEYYNLSGIKVGKFSSTEQARKTLPSGIYIVKSESKTFKVTL